MLCGTCSFNASLTDLRLLNNLKTNEMRNLIYVGLAFFTLLLLTACSSLSITSDYDRAIDFSKFKTFALYKQNNVGIVVSELNKERILLNVKANLIAKGLVETTETPDLWVNITTVMKPKTEIVANTYNPGGYYRPYGYGYGFGGSTSTIVGVVNYIEGSLIIDLISATTNNIVWHGSGNKKIDSPSRNPDNSIKKAISQIMYSFPKCGVVSAK